MATLITTSGKKISITEEQADNIFYGAIDMKIQPEQKIAITDTEGVKHPMTYGDIEEIKQSGKQKEVAPGSILEKMIESNPNNKFLERIAKEKGIR